MFNDPIAVEQLKKLHQQFKFDVLVETGTNTGFGSVVASRICPVVTIEVNPMFRASALDYFRTQGFQGHPIVSLFGSSADVLHSLFIQGRCCFYLDAHWEEYWPLRDELEAIRLMNKPDSVIIIHDCKVPGHPWGFDSYGGVNLDLDYVKPWLDRINPDFDISYNEQAAGNMRGILYATPKMGIVP